MLNHWNDGPALKAINEFVDRVTNKVTPDYVPPEERIAVFDNDGTLWCEKPAYIQLAFILRRLAEKAASDPGVQDKQPYRAATAGDLSWFGAAITKHYQGDDTDLKLLAAAGLALHESLTVEQYTAHVDAFFARAHHPTLDRLYRDCTYSPMVELLRYLESNGFVCYVVSGGGRDFMRPVTSDIYGIPPERIVGSAQGLRFDGGDLYIKPELDVFDDGPEKPVRIWSRIGRRPLVAVGNSNGDDEMLQYARGLRLLIVHDDAEREFAYTAGAERVLERAGTEGWTVVSMRDDWSEVFGTGSGSGIVTEACE